MIRNIMPRNNVTALLDKCLAYKKQVSLRMFFPVYLILLIVLCLLCSGILAHKYVLYKTGLPLFAYRPLISVLVTSYNYEQYISQTLDSILKQTYKNYEVIIVDDGSTDNSISIINEYINKYKNFHLYQHKGHVNKGLPDSVKLGIEKSKGDYIAFLESDDYWIDDALLERVKMINKYPDAVIISNNVTNLFASIGIKNNTRRSNRE